MIRSLYCYYEFRSPDASVRAGIMDERLGGTGEVYRARDTKRGAGSDPGFHGRRRSCCVGNENSWLAPYLMVLGT